jgi:hypothetical protein
MKTMGKLLLVIFLVLIAGWLRVTMFRPSMVVTTTPVAAAHVPDALDLAARAAPYVVIAACGEPQRKWMTVSGRGQYETDTWHLWYPKIPAEVLVVAWPQDTEEQMHYWTYSGTFRSKSDQDGYTPDELRKKMPCMKRWADAWDEAAKQNGDTVPSKLSP